MGFWLGNKFGWDCSSERRMIVNGERRWNFSFVRGVEEKCLCGLVDSFRMSPNLKLLSLWAAFAGILALAGCSTRKPGTAHGVSFRLESFRDDSLLLPPS